MPNPINIKRGMTINLVLGLFALSQVAWNVSQIITGNTPNIILTVAQYAGAFGWLIGGIIWLRVWRQERLRTAGWVKRKVQHRQQLTYIGQDSQIDQQALVAWLQHLRDQVYVVKTSTGQVVSRAELASTLHTSVGLINDLYPITGRTKAAEAMTHLLNLTTVRSAPRRLLLGHQLRRLYRRGGWLGTLHAHTVQTVLPQGEVYAETGYDVCREQLQRVGIPDGKAKAILQDHWLLAYLLEDLPRTAEQLTQTNRTFDPAALQGSIDRWYRAYKPLMIHRG